MLAKTVLFSLIVSITVKTSVIPDPPDAWDKDDPESPAGTESNIKFTANRIVTGLEYLGSGFDAVKSNTTGSIDNGEDLGHRAPIVDFYWSRSDVGVTNSLDWLQPVGGWVRPIIACGETQTVEETEEYSNNEDIKKLDIGVQASIGVGQGGNLNIGYNDATKNKMNRSTKVHKSSYYCFTYAAGMPPYLDWDTTEEFQEEKEELAREVTIFDNCSVEQFKNRDDACDEVAKWMEFFALFGTHVTTEIHLGGRIIRYLTAPTEALDTYSKLGFNLDAAVKALINGIVIDSGAGLSQNQTTAFKKLSDSCELRFSVLGGIHVGNHITPSSLMKWRATVSKFPMPIKVTVTPMDQFLGPEYEQVYREAVNFYVTINGALPWLVQAHNGIEFNLRTMVAASYPMVTTSMDVANVKIECPANKRVLFGFVLDYDTHDHTFSAYPCTSQRKTCMKENLSSHQTVIWALCGNSMGLDIVQHMQTFEDGEGEKVVKCPAHYTIVTGFSLVISPKNDYHLESFQPCQTGEEHCEAKSDRKTIIWIACVDKRFPGIESVTTKAESYAEESKSLHLAEKHITLTGLKARFGKVLYASVCEKYTLGCALENTSEASEAILSWGLFRKLSE